MTAHHKAACPAPVNAEFGPFYCGICSDLDDVLTQLGLG